VLGKTNVSVQLYISIFKMLYFGSSLYNAAFIFLVQILRFYNTYIRITSTSTSFWSKLQQNMGQIFELLKTET
jgi:hypothetical protein